MRVRPLRWVGRVLGIIGLTSVLLVPATAAWAQTSGPYIPTNPPTTVDPCGGKGLPVIGQVNGVDVCGVVSAQRQSTTPSGSLPFTGTNVIVVVGLGLIVLIGGVVLVRLGRRPNTT